MNKIAIFTIASKNYISLARTLMDSIAEFHNNFDLYLMLADKLENAFDAKKEDFEIIDAEELEIPEFSKMAFRYDVMEFNTALKPFAFQYLFKKGYTKVVYFDPDILLFNRLDYLLELLNNYSIILTPHITQPIEDCYSPSEIDFLKSGVYNLGFIAMSSSRQATDIINWWCTRCFKDCYSEFETGLFVDQKWIDLVPSLSDSIYILRDMGYNMAYWNLHERYLEDGVLVNESYPLVFFHFSGFNADNIDVISKYQNRYSLSQREDLRGIFQMYREKLNGNGYQDTRHLRYYYGHYKNGDVIGSAARRLYIHVENMFNDPFATNDCSYHKLLKNRRLLEATSGMIYIKENVGNKAYWVNLLLRLSCKVLGIDRYNALMKYLRFITVIRNQDFLIK